MKIFRSWQCYFLSILAVPSFADSSISVDDLSLMIYGASVHTQCTESQSGNGKPCDFSYWNPGLGLDWAFWGDSDIGKLSVRGGVYRDSYYEWANFAGVAYFKAWPFFELYHAGVGVQAGYLNGSAVDGFVFLPMITVGYQRFTLEVGYAPKTNAVPGRNHSAVTFFSGRWAF